MVLPSHAPSSPFAGRSSPNSRSSEIGSPIRRSFSGNPFPKPSIVTNPRSLNPTTPANSPSDYPRRNSLSRDGLFSRTDNEEKENGKDHQSPKPSRLRSPSVGKSTKNFMSPTISAASKFAASPKKKILGDRNDQVRSSLSFSTSKIPSINSLNHNPESSTALDSDTNLQIALNPISKPSKTVRFGGVEVISCPNDDPEVIMMADEPDAKLEIAPISTSNIETTPLKTSKTLESANVEVISISTNDLESPAKSDLTEDVDCVNLDPSFKISPISSPIGAASLDADLLMAAPYDPKTNYLSPRPQFLHYKPRRINQHELNGGLEELFSSTIVSEPKFTEEIDSKDPLIDSDEAENESQIEEEEEEEEEEMEEEEEEEIVRAKKSSKLHFSRMFKISSLLLILFTVCVVNVYDLNILERASLLNMEDSTEIFEFARTNLDVFLGKLEIWHENTKSFVSDVILDIRGRPLIYLNQTEFLLNDSNPNGQCVLLSHPNREHEMKETEIVDSFVDHNEDEQESLQKIEEAVMEKVIEEDHNEDEQEQESLQEIDAITETEINGEPVETDPQNEEDEQLFHEIEDKANESKDIEESLQEIIGDTSANSSSDELNEEEHIQEKHIEDHYEVSASNFKILDQIEQEPATIGESEKDHYEVSASNFKILDQIEQEPATIGESEKDHYEVSASNFKILDQIEQEPATIGESEKEHADSIQQSNTEFQYQSPPISPPSEPQSYVENENGKNVDLIKAATKISRDLSQNTVVIVSAILLGFTLIAGLIYTRKSGLVPSMAATSIAEEKNEQIEQSLPEVKKTNSSPIVREEEEPINDDDDDQSYSYETSSFQYSSMREGEPETGKRSCEAQSHSHSHSRKMRKNSRRESMASSSLDEDSVSISASPSYGSFTTYEKVTIKHENGDDEIVTPVRRSSRIRKATQH